MENKFEIYLICFLCIIGLFLGRIVFIQNHNPEKIREQEYEKYLNNFSEEEKNFYAFKNNKKILIDKERNKNDNSTKKNEKLTVEEEVISLNEKEIKNQKEKIEKLKKTVPIINKTEKAEITVEKEVKKDESFLLFHDSIVVTEKEFEILSKIIEAEAGGEPFEGKVAVGAVILNRVRSPLFSNNIEDVVFSSLQFEPTSNGVYYKISPSKDSYKAAREALLGKDPVKEALYFYSPTLTESRWHETLTYITTIGNHKFFK